MKTLIVYYSRSGVTKIVADKLAKALNADIEELQDQKKRAGALAYAVAAKDAVLKKSTEIAPLHHDPEKYDLIILGTPVWANTMCCATRKFLQDNGQKIAQAALFCTTGRTGINQTNLQMEELIVGNVIAAIGLVQKAVKQDKIADDLEEFLFTIEDNYQDLRDFLKPTWDFQN